MKVINKSAILEACKEVEVKNEVIILKGKKTTLKEIRIDKLELHKEFFGKWEIDALIKVNESITELVFVSADSNMLDSLSNSYSSGNLAIDELIIKEVIALIVKEYDR